jgi:hypothetical protein
MARWVARAVAQPAGLLAGAACRGAGHALGTRTAPGGCSRRRWPPPPVGAAGQRCHTTSRLPRAPQRTAPTPVAQVHLGLLQGRAAYVVWPPSRVGRVESCVPANRVVIEEDGSWL